MTTAHSPVLKRILLFMAGCLSLFQSGAQIRPLKCTGPVPDVILKSSTTKAREILSKSAETTDDKETLAQFEIASTFIIDDIFQSGKVLYGDTCTNYVNQIANHILKSDTGLRNSLHFFTLRSDVVNAFSTHQGYIFVTTGLLSRVNNEAQLAFILCHEISHYLEKHTWKSAKLGSDLDNNNQDNIDSKLSELYRYSRNQEYDADSIGYRIYEKAGYDAKEALEALRVIGRIDESFQNFELSDSIFSTPHFQFTHNNRFVSPTEGGLQFEVTGKYETRYDSLHYFDLIATDGDSLSTHPSVNRRLLRLADFGRSNTQSDVFISTSQVWFETMRNYARLDETLARLRQGDLVTALYNTYVLEDAGMDNATLSDIRAMAMYGLAMHSFHKDDMSQYGVLQDRSKGVNTLSGVMNDLSTEELFLLTLRVVYFDFKKDTQSTFKKNVMRSVMSILDNNSYFIWPSLESVTCNLDTGNLGTNLYCDLRDSTFIKLRKEFQSVGSDKTTFDTKEFKTGKKVQNQIVTNLMGYKYYKPNKMGLDSLLVISPTYTEYRIRNGKRRHDYFKDAAIESMLTDEVRKYSDLLNMKIDVLVGAGDSKLTSDDINQYAEIIDLLEERMSHGKSTMLMYSSVTQKQMKSLAGYNVAWVHNVVLKGDANKFTQLVYIYNPSIGELTTVFFHEFKGRAKPDMIKAHLFDIFYQINKKKRG